VINIPSERPAHLAEGDLFGNATVYFGRGRRLHMDCQCRGEAELVARIANLGVTGEVCVPKTNQGAAKLLSALNTRHEQAAAQLRELAANRSGDAETQAQIFGLLERWYVLGKT